MATQQAIGADQVQQFVIAGHGNLEQVQSMLAEQPGLLNAANDWGNGDWETALGGAAHMGRRDIALFLLEKGARMDIYAAAMLGETGIVRAMLASFPEMRHTPGPHGIPLIVHAQQGGEQAAEVLQMLEAMDQ